jgi:hypothetical protein
LAARRVRVEQLAVFALPRAMAVLRVGARLDAAGLLVFARVVAAAGASARVYVPLSTP